MMAIFTLALAILAIFQDWFRAKIRHPELDVTVKLSPPSCHKIRLARHNPQGELEAIADAYYLRLRIANSGNQRAELVEVFADELSRLQADGTTFKPVDSFLPMNLLWSHHRQVFFPAISPGMYRHCDLAHIIDPPNRKKFRAEDNQWPNVSPEETILSFDTFVKPHTLSHLLPPGTYRLVISVAAANAMLVRKGFQITLTGNWYEDEQKMLEEGIGILEID
jgi:hypothetical protein